MIGCPPISTRTDTLFPYTTRFRSSESRMEEDGAQSRSAAERAPEETRRATPLTSETPGDRSNENRGPSDSDLNVRISSDETNNAILVFGTPRAYAVVEDALRKLDVRPAPVRRSEERRVGAECVSTGKS